MSENSGKRLSTRVFLHGETCLDDIAGRFGLSTSRWRLLLSVISEHQFALWPSSLSSRIF